MLMEQDEIIDDAHTVPILEVKSALAASAALFPQEFRYSWRDFRAVTAPSAPVDPIAIIR
jgi:hypothetical protein